MNPQTETIQGAVFARVAEEAEQWGPTTGDPGPGSPTLSSEAILKALNSNEDGDARLFIDHHRGGFLFDHAAGQWFQWVEHLMVRTLLVNGYSGGDIKDLAGEEYSLEIFEMVVIPTLSLIWEKHMKASERSVNL